MQTQRVGLGIEHVQDGSSDVRLIDGGVVDEEIVEVRRA